MKKNGGSSLAQLGARYSLVLYMGIVLISSSAHAQTLSVRPILDSAWIYMDYTDLHSAQRLGQSAEVRLLAEYDTLDLKLAETYALLGIVAQRRNDQAAFNRYTTRLGAMPIQQTSLLEQAHVAFFRANDPRGWQTAARLYRRAGAIPHQNLIKCYTNLGVVHMRSTEYRAAYAAFDTAKMVKQQLFGAKLHPLEGNYLNNRGLAQWQQGLTRHAEQLLNQALDVRTKALLPLSRDRGATLNNLGLVYTDRGLLEMAQTCFEEALAIGDRLGADGGQLVTFVTGNLGMVADRRGDYALSLKYYKQLLTFSEDPESKSESYLSMAMTYHRFFEKNDNLSAYLDSTAIYLDSATLLMPARYFRQADLIKAKGMLRVDHNDFEGGERLFRIAMEQGSGVPFAVQCRFNLAKMYQKQGRYVTALAHCDTALVNMGYAPNATASTIDYPTETVSILMQRNAILWAQYQEEPDAVPAEYLLGKVMELEQVLDSIRYFYIELEDWANMRKSMGENIEIALQLLLGQKSDRAKAERYREQMFQLAERTRAQTLVYRLAERETLKNLSKAEQRKFEMAKEALVACNAMIVTLLPYRADPAAAAILDDSIAKKRDYLNILNNISKKILPSYSTAAAFASQQLNNNQTFVEFLVGERIGVALILNKDRPLQVVPFKADSLVYWVTKMTRDGIWQMERNVDNDGACKTYTEAAHWLHQLLIKPIEPYLKKQVIISPASALNLVPFSALLSRPIALDDDLCNFRTYPFWVLQHDIGYAFSANAQAAMARQKSVPKGTENTWIVVPFAQNHPYMYPFSSEKYNDTLRVFGSIASTWDMATKLKSILRSAHCDSSNLTIERFKRELPKYSQLHLLSHGYGNSQSGDYSWIALRNGNYWQRFYAKDIRQMRLHLDLVVLEGCEMHIGSFEQFEGAVHNAHAFAVAGTRNILSTLWQIDVNKVGPLMPDFYLNLKQGQSKVVALSEAQRNFIKSANNASPRHWAAYIITGPGD